MNKPKSYKSEHAHFLAKIGEAGVSESMLAHWLHAAYPELPKTTSQDIVKYWRQVTGAEKQQKGNKKL